MTFDFVDGLDCDPLDLDRRLKQAEDNPPGPGPTPTPGGVDYDYSTQPVLTTALPHWGKDFDGVNENEIVLKDNGVFMHLGIAYTSQLKLFIRAWAPRSSYGNQSGSGFTGVAMLYLGDGSKSFSNNGSLPTVAGDTISGSIMVTGYPEFVSQCFGSDFKEIIALCYINNTKPLSNAGSYLIGYRLQGSFDSTGLFSFTVQCICDDVDYDYYPVFDVTTGFDSSVLMSFQAQKTLEFCEGFFSFMSYVSKFCPGGNLNQLQFPSRLSLTKAYKDLGAYEADRDYIDPDTGWYETEKVVIARANEPIFERDRQLVQQEPDVYFEGIDIPLNLYTKYTSVYSESVTPRARVAAGQSFKPGYVAENLPAEWNAM